MTELEKKKRMLTTEAEVYRQLLKLQFHNVRICTVKMRRRFTSFSSINPLFMTALPMVGSLFFRRRRASFFSWRRFGTLALLGFQALRAARPFVNRPPRRPRQTETEEFLSKRI